MTAETTVVFPDRVEKITSIRTVACDDWRAAVQLTGEFDVANAALLRAELGAHLDAGRRVLRIDTSAVHFVDSTAIGVIVAANFRCLDERGTLILTGVRPGLKRLLGIAGLDQVLLVDTASDEFVAGAVRVCGCGEC